MSDTNLPAAVPRWRVISQTPANGPTGTGTYGPGHVVIARLESGSQFQVFVPDADYHIETVRALLQAKAEHVAAVDRLTGPAVT